MVERHSTIVLLSVVAITIGCSADPPADTDSDAHAPPTLSWEDFKQRAEPTSRLVQGEKVYIVEWDIPVTEAQLYEYYLNRYVTTEKSTVDVLTGGGDNKWTHPAQLKLTYCVSTAFGSHYARMKGEAERATLSWMQTSNVAFIYKSAEDANCVDSNPAVEVPIVPFAGGGACAFFPIQDGQPHCTDAGRAVVLDVDDIDTWPAQTLYGKIFPNVTTEGTLRHELGHVLGLRHEHIREANNAIDYCDPDNNPHGQSEVLTPGPNRALTEYDVNSAMHYPWCDGITTSAQFITPKDAEGAMQLYGPPAWFEAIEVL
jgi:hypothetical protein